MLKMLNIIEKIEDPDGENMDSDELPEKTDSPLEKICQENRKNELVRIVYGMVYGEGPHIPSYEVERHIQGFLRDMERLKAANPHFDRYVVWSLFDCLRKSANRFEFIGKALGQFNLMRYGAETLGELFDIYWDEQDMKKLDQTVLAGIVKPWEGPP